MNYKKILKDRRGFTWAAMAITMLVAIAVAGIGGAVTVNYFFKQADRQMEAFESCVKRTGDAVECQKAEAQRAQPETAMDAGTKTPPAGEPEITKKSCEEDQGIYIVNKEKCDELLRPAGATF